MRQGLGNDSLAIGLIADIALHESAAQFVGDGLAFFSLHVRNDHLAAFGRASMRAVPSPKPDAPPVTMKTLPAISMSTPCSKTEGD